jgi:hypothetical protein
MNKINKYNNSVIYEIKCKNPDVKSSYIGSTTNYKKRIINHKSVCNNKNSKDYNCFVYQYIRCNGGWENFEHNILETICCDNKLELYKKERYYVDLNENNLNKQIPSRTIQEYYEDNKEHYEEYYENNKNKISEKKKEHYEDNKDKILERNKEYYEKNKNKILEIRNKKFNCECGGKYTKTHKSVHYKTKKHIEYIKLNN